MMFETDRASSRFRARCFPLSSWTEKHGCCSLSMVFKARTKKPLEGEHIHQLIFSRQIVVQFVFAVK
jgi:hypothetical protein